MNIIQRVKQKLMHYSWDLAYGVFSESIIKDGIKPSSLHVVKNPYKSKWFADPFILSESETKIQFLVEESDYSVNRGRIARLVVNKSNDIIEECHILLDLPTHLSFPAIYYIDNKIFVHPENYASGKSYIYEYDLQQDQLVNPILISNRALTDAIIVKKNCGYEILTTYGENPNGNDLVVLESENFKGPYLQKQILDFPNCKARMAGFLFDTSLGKIRPAQDCNGAYGKAVVFYKDNNVVGEILPFGKYDGIHTFNTLGNSFVIDLKKYDYRFVYKINNLIK